MDDLVRWLGEQLDEDERIARAALAERGGVWTYAETPGGDHRVLDSLGYAVVEYPAVESEPWFTLPHVAEWDPARVLREIDAKRQIVAAYLPPGADPHPGLPCMNYEGQDPAYYDEYDSCARHLEANKRLIRHDHVLRLLALPYADRPGYREEWRP